MVNQRLDLRILHDREWLIANRNRLCREDLAAELNCHAGSIAWAERFLSKEDKKDFVYKRIHKKPESL